MGTEDMADMSAIITAMSEQAGSPGSILRTDLMEGHYPAGEAQDCPVLQHGAGLKPFSGEAREAHRRGPAGSFAVMDKGLLPELVQVHLSDRVTAGSSGPRATADSKAVPMRAASRIKALAAVRFPRAFPVRIRVDKAPVVVPVLPDEEVPAAMVEASMEENVVKGKPLQGRSGPCLLLAVSSIREIIMRSRGDGGRNDG
jgi:hypothetical protein